MSRRARSRELAQSLKRFDAYGGDPLPEVDPPDHEEQEDPMPWGEEPHHAQDLQAPTPRPGT